eukprot:12884936-Prorocentrum_lima.AAC.1
MVLTRDPSRPLLVMECQFPTRPPVINVQDHQAIQEHHWDHQDSDCPGRRYQQTPSDVAAT